MKINPSNTTRTSRARSHSTTKIEIQSYFNGHPPKWSEIVEQEKQTRIKHEINLANHNGNLTDYFRQLSEELNTKYDNFISKLEPKLEPKLEEITISNPTQSKINLKRSASFSSSHDLLLAPKKRPKNLSNHHSSGILFHPANTKQEQENFVPLKIILSNQKESEESPASENSPSLNSSFIESEPEKESPFEIKTSLIKSPQTGDKRIESLELAQEALELLINANNENKKSTWTLWGGKEEKSETIMIRLTHEQVLALRDKLHEVPPEKQLEKEESSELLTLKINVIEFKENINDRVYKKHKGSYVFNIDRSILLGSKEELILISNEVLDELNRIKQQILLNI